MNEPHRERVIRPRRIRQRRASIAARGFTLLEVIVTLVLLALGAALVAPALRNAAPAPDDALDLLIARARESAVRRAQTLVLSVEPTGAWRLTPDMDTVLLAEGTLAREGARVTVRLSPLGACVVRPVRAAPRDAISCARAAARSP